MAYITLAELDTLIKSAYTTCELSKVEWGTISDADKTIYISRAEDKIDSIKFRGAKVDTLQSQSFPRIINTVNVGIPADIKLAVACFVYNNLSETKSVSDEFNIKRGLGLTSIKLGDISESYSDTVISNINLLDKKVIYTYINKYIMRNSIMRGVDNGVY